MCYCISFGHLSFKQRWQLNNMNTQSIQQTKSSEINKRTDLKQKKREKELLFYFISVIVFYSFQNNNESRILFPGN